MLSWFRELAKEMPLDNYYLFLRRHPTRPGADLMMFCLVIKDGYYTIDNTWDFIKNNTSLYGKYTHNIRRVLQNRPGMYFLEYSGGRFIRYIYRCEDKDRNGDFRRMKDGRFVFAKEYGFIPKDEEERKKLTEFFVEEE